MRDEMTPPTEQSGKVPGSRRLGVTVATGGRTFTLDILTEPDHLREIADEWRALVLHPHTLPEIFLGFTEADAEVLHPLVPILRDEQGRIVAMAIARLQLSRLSRSGSYIPNFGRKCRVIVVPADGFIGGDAQFTPLIATALIDFMDAGGADVLECPFMPIGSDHHARLLADCPRFGDATAFRNAHWFLDLESTFEKQLQNLGRSTRGTLRNNLNRFHREFKGRYEIARHRPGESLEQLLDHSTRIANSSYHGGLGAGFSTSPRELAIYRAADELGVLWSRMLLIDGRPAAFMHALALKDVLTGTHMAYTSGLTKLPIGTILMMKTVEDLIEDGRFRRWDFGSGDAEYKRRICTTEHVDERRNLFAKTLRGRGMRVSSALIDGTERLARSTLDRLNLDIKVRTMLRNRKRGAG